MVYRKIIIKKPKKACKRGFVIMIFADGYPIVLNMAE